MRFEKELTTDSLVYKIYGQMSVSNFEEIDKLIKDIKQHADFLNKGFIWDFTDMPFIDSTGLSVIALTVAHSIKNGRFVGVYGANEEIMRVLKTARMESSVKYIKVLSAFTSGQNKRKALNLVEDLS